jgi:hypothetical protein
MSDEPEPIIAPSVPPEIIEGAWQEAVVALRNKYQHNMERWITILNGLIEKGADGEKIDKILIEAIKTGLRFFDPSKDEKVSGVQKASKATARAKSGERGEDNGPHVSKDDEERIRRVLEGRSS